VSDLLHICERNSGIKFHLAYAHKMKLPCRTYDIEGLRYAELNKKRKLLYKYLAGKKLKDFDLKY